MQDQHQAPLDCAIIGAGPAGLTAAIYLCRFHRRLALIDGGSSRALKISRSQNCPGYPDGISGPELLSRLGRQLQRFGGHVLRGKVRHLRRGGNGLFELQLSGEARTVSARAVLLCTGVSDRLPHLPGVEEVCAADRLRQCPICDGYEYTGRTIGVLGNAEHALREAEFLRRYGAEVGVLPTEPAGDQPVARELAVEGEGVRVTLGDAEGRHHDVRYDVLYAALGVVPRTALARELGARLDDKGNITVDAHCRSSIEGLYAAGDVVNALDQIAVAFGQGAIAATAIHNDLRARAAAAGEADTAPEHKSSSYTRPTPDA